VVTGPVMAETQIKAGSADFLPWSPELLSWHECGNKLAIGRAVNPNEVRAAMYLLGTHSVDSSPSFLKLAASVIAAESGFNPSAVSPAGAYGLMQLTTIGAKEAAIQCRLPYARGVSDETLVARLMDNRANVKYGTCLLKYYLDYVDGNRTLALVLYNGGYAQLTRLIQTGTLSKETQEYILRVNSYLGRCL
jgi:membrane-bound lytic murein transglycosylase MltF